MTVAELLADRHRWWVPPIFGAEGDEPGPPDPDGDAVDDDDQDEPADDDTREEEIRDPKAKIASLTEANHRLAKKLDKKDKLIRDLEGRVGELEKGGDLRTARLELGLLKTAIEHTDRIRDLDTAWELGQAHGYFDAVKVGEDGSVEGMAEALTRLLERYPWLIDDDSEPDDEPTPRPLGAPKKPVGQGRKQVGPDQAGLANRFPALKRRRVQGR